MISKNETEFMLIERYKPQKLEEMILPESFREQIKEWISEEKCPNLLLSSNTPGVGKTLFSNIIGNELDTEVKFINASLESGVDVIRSKIFDFASTTSFDGNQKIVVLDECLDENEEVKFGTLDNPKHMKLNELQKNKIYDCISFNMETGNYENDTCEIISDKIDDIYEVEFEDGRKIQVTKNHPFIIFENGKYIQKSIQDGLNTNDEVVDFNEKF